MDPGKEIEVDPDLDPERGLKRIRIRPNAVDPGVSGSGSATLITMVFLYEIIKGILLPTTATAASG